MPFGIVAIIFAAQVQSKLGMGDISGAMQASKNAKTWSTVALICGAVIIGLYLIVGVVSVMSGERQVHYGY